MSLTAEQITQVAHLARLQIDSQQTEHYARQLSNIMELVDQLARVETAVAPMAHPLDMAQRLRVDAVTEVDQREVFQGNAPQVDQGLFLVPKVIE